MPVTSMNHFTILTDDLDATLDFYAEFLCLRPGPRPPFTFPGAWLYAEAGNDPILHIVAGRDRKDLVKGVLDHMAYSGRDLAGTVSKLKAKRVPYELRRLPEYRTWQLFFHDPNQAKIEIDFDASEPAPA
jgi:catechol 2,3-dioxygenase-like lactoylglutathione lyase family enzyme